MTLDPPQVGSKHQSQVTMTLERPGTWSLLWAYAASATPSQPSLTTFPRVLPGTGNSQLLGTVLSGFFFFPDNFIRKHKLSTSLRVLQSSVSCRVLTCGRGSTVAVTMPSPCHLLCAVPQPSTEINLSHFSPPSSLCFSSLWPFMLNR